ARRRPDSGRSFRNRSTRSDRIWQVYSPAQAIAAPLRLWSGSAGPGESVRRVGCHLRARTGGPPAPLSLLLRLAPANLAALLGLPLSFPVGGALYVVQNQGVHDAPRRGRADPIGAATDTLAPRA